MKDNQIGYNASTHGFLLKLVISIALGFISLLLSPYGISETVKEVKLDLPWSLLLPIIVSLAFGWRFGLISSLAGAAFFPFILWPGNGLPNFLISILFAFFLTSIGLVNRQTTNSNISKTIIVRYIKIVLTFSLVYAILLLLFFNKLLELNISIYKGSSILTRLDNRLIVDFIIKDCINISILTIVADLLLRLPVLRKFLGLGVSKSMRFNLQIFISTILICLLIWISFVGLGYVILQDKSLADGHYIIALEVIIVGGLIAARSIMFFVERQSIALQEKSESETYLKLQFNKMPIAYIVWDENLKVKSWNPAAEKLFGYKESDVKGKTAYETIVSSQQKESLSELWYDLKFKGIDNHCVNENVSKSGERIICNWINTPIKDRDGAVVEIISMVLDITQNHYINDCLKFLANRVWSNEFDNFFDALTEYVGKSIGVDYVLIARLSDDAISADTISVFANDEKVPKIKYLLEGTPCYNVVGNKMCIYKNGVQTLFPKDTLLVKMQAESYIGIPLWNSKGESVGVMAVLNKKPLENTEIIESILSLVSSRVNAELEKLDIESELKKSEENYRLLFENMTSGFALHEMIYDDNDQPVDYRYIAANPAFEKLTGISLTSVVGKRVKEFLPNLEQYWIDTYSKVAQTGKSITYQNYSKEIDKYFDTLVFSPQKNQFAVVFNDITSNKIAETSIKESEASLSSLINNRNDAIWSIDVDYKFIAINSFFKEQYLKFFNIELKKGMNALDILSPELRTLWKDNYDIALSGKRYQFEFLIDSPIGLQYYEVFLNPIISENVVSGASALSVNITERKQVELLLVESEKSYSGLFNSVSEAIYIQDETGYFIDVNVGVEKMYGYRREEIIGETPEFLSAKGMNDLNFISKLIENTFLTGQSHQFEFWGKRKNGEIFPKEVVANKGKFFGRDVIITTARDVSQRKQFERELQESEYFFKESQRAANVGSYKTDFVKGCWESSEVLDQIFGITKDYERSIKGWLDIVHPDDQLMMSNYLTNEVVGNKHSFNKEYRVLRKSDNATRWVLGLGVPKFDNDGNIVTLIGTIQDITERRLADEIIRKTQANLTAIIENTQDSIWAINTDYQVMYINNIFKEDFFENFGVLLEEGMNILNTVPDSIRQVWKSRYDRAFKNEHYIIEDKIDLNGNSLFIELSVNPIVVDGIVVGASLFSRDITERKQAEEALRISEERFKIVSESAEEWVWEVDKDGLYTYSNQIVEKILGYKPEEIIGKKHFYDFFEPENKELFKEKAFSMFSQILAFKDFENVNIHKDGSKVIFKTSGSPILDSDGLMIGYRGADIDITIQKRIETALLESEEKYRLTFMTSPDAVSINTVNGVYVDVNEGFTSLSGFSKQDLIGLTSLEIGIWFKPEDRKKFIKQLLKEGYVSNLESVLKCKDGTLKTVLMSSRIIQIYNVQHILSIIRDITERKQMEDAIALNEQKYRTLFERSNDAIFVVDKKSGMYLDANKAAERLTGYNLKQLIKLSTSDLSPIGSGNRLSKLKRSHKTVELGEIEYFRPDGTNRFANITVVPFSEDRVFGIAHDITERKQYEDALSILSSAVDQSPVSVVITDTNGVIEYVNPKFVEITGFGIEDVIGKTPNVLKTGYTTDNEYKQLWETIRSGKEWRGIFQNKKKSGEKFWESALISPISNDNGEITHFLAVKEDITDKKDAERRILSSIIETEEKERNRFSRELHDGLGPLLSTIKLYFQWISETDDQEKKQLIIEKGEKNINEAIESIREISNNLSPRTLSTFGTIAAIKNFIDNVNQTNKILIEFESNTNRRFDKNLEIVLFRITSELINNTLKYANASKSTIKIEYVESSSTIFLFYTDNGKGFDKEEMMSNGKGMGLLNIAHRVNTLEGRFSIDSSIGDGVQVEIELPVLINKNNE